MKGGNTEVGCGPWGKRGARDQRLAWDGSGCVAEEQNDLQEGFFYSRQGTFLIARA